MQYLALVALALVAGCTQPVDAPSSFVDTTPELDAGGDAALALDAVSAPDSVIGQPDAGADAHTVDSAPTTDAVIAIDANDAGAKVDAVTTPEASAPDATPAVDAGSDGAIAIDVGNDTATIDAPSTSDAGADAGNVDPVCTSSATGCQKAIETDTLIRSTFSQPCAPEGDRKCGGVWRGVVETLPMICRDAQWRLAGSWTGVQWAPLYTCSSGCGMAGKICNP